MEMEIMKTEREDKTQKIVLTVNIYNIKTMQRAYSNDNWPQILAKNIKKSVGKFVQADHHNRQNQTTNLN